MSANPYLEGNFAPVTEEVTAFDLRVTGEIPRELSGRLLRIGPNPIEHARSREVPLVHRQRHGARPAPAATAAPSGIATAGSPTTPSPRSAQPAEDAGPASRHGPRRRQHQRDRPRGPHLGDRRGGRPARRALRRARDADLLRLRRHAPGLVHRAPEGRPRHRRAARDGLLLGVGLRAVRRRRHRRPRAQDGERPRARQADDPRLRDHRALRRRLRPALHLRRAGRHERPLPVRLESRVRRARGPAAARRPGQRRALVRGAALLRVPSDERVRDGGRPGRDGRVPAPEDVRPRQERAERRPADARPLGDRSVRRARSRPRRSRTSATSSRVTTSAASASRSASATPAASATISASARSTSTISSSARPRSTAPNPAACSSSRSSCRARRTPTKTTAGSWPTSTTRRRTGARS